jgi:hypothetical protein
MVRIHPRGGRETPKGLGAQTCREERIGATASSHKSGTGNLEAPLALATGRGWITGKPAVIRCEQRHKDWPPENLLIKW